MKNKDKSKAKTKKPEPKKQVKRPAHKKPRPKKYVEARTPKQTKEKQDAVEAKKASSETAKPPIPEQAWHDQVMSVDLLNTVDVFAESPPVPGVIRRLPYNDEKNSGLKDEYVKMLKEEEEASRNLSQARNNSNSLNVTKTKQGLLSRFLNLFKF